MPELAAEDRAEIADVMLNYAAGVDDRNRDQYSNCFDEHVEVFGFGDEPIRGRGAWVDYVFAALASYGATQHLLVPPLVTLDGDRARVRTDVQAMHTLKSGDHERLVLWATYFSEMERRAAGWQIVRHELVSRSIKQD